MLIIANILIDNNKSKKKYFNINDLLLSYEKLIEGLV